jgi:hypothetical protein
MLRRHFTDVRLLLMNDILKQELNTELLMLGEGVVDGIMLMDTTPSQGVG